MKVEKNIIDLKQRTNGCSMVNTGCHLKKLRVNTENFSNFVS